MINFRYHIVSLMAVFLALAVGIAVGVSLSPSVTEGITEQAIQDRKQVVELRQELDRVNALDEYRDAWSTRTGNQLSLGALTGVGVGLVVMPGAPAAVLDALRDEVELAGGTIVSTATLDADAFDPAQAEAVVTALGSYETELGTDATTTPATRLGRALSWSVAATTPQDRDEAAVAMGEVLEQAGLVALGGDTTRSAELLLVVGAAATDPATDPEIVQEHVRFDRALRYRAAGVVLAGPDSAGVEGTDVLAVRSDADAASELSTVDVADLPSGITTTVLAGQEQLLGRQGHYGAQTRADAPLPTLPVN